MFIGSCFWTVTTEVWLTMRNHIFTQIPVFSLYSVSFVQVLSPITPHPHSPTTIKQTPKLAAVFYTCFVTGYFLISANWHWCYIRTFSSIDIIYKLSSVRGYQIIKL